jgi:hypothetical protein
MKTIESTTVWFNGQEQQATVLLANANSDNLIDSASFSYSLLKQGEYNPMNSGLIGLASGGLTMSGEAYQNWHTNDYAYEWVAQQLNLTITGNYNPPQPTPTPTETSTGTPQPTPTPTPTPSA